jgi:hypothetical protein
MPTAMTPEETMKWVEEIRLRCRFALHAWRQLRGSLPAMDKEQSFFYVHAFLDHVTEIACILWPDKDPGKERGQVLRTALAMKDQPLLEPALNRDICKCFDENLDRWMKSLDRRSCLGMNIMPKGTLAGSREDRFIRNLDPETYQLGLMDHDIDLGALHEALQALDQDVNRWLRNH